MADNIELNAGSGGATLATDQAVGGEHYQYVKVAFGADNTQTLVASGVAGLPVEHEGPVSLTGSLSVVVSNTVNVEVIGDVSLTGSMTVFISNTVNTEVVGDVSLTGSMSVFVSNTVSTEVVGDVSLTGSMSVFISNTVNVEVVGDVSLTGSMSVFVSNTVTVSLSGSTSAFVQGMAAHDAAVSGNPVLQGLEARTTLPTAVGNGDAVRAMADDNGRQVVTPVAPRDLVGMSPLSLTVSTTTTLLPAGGAGVLRDIIGFVVTNPSSVSQALVILYTANGSGTSLSGMTEIFYAELSPSGGLVYTPSVPIPAAAANKPWGIKCNVTGLKCSVQYANNN